jgi:hypothetical protein
MKIINLNDSQFGRIFEGVTDGDFGKSSVPEYQDLSKVTTQAKIIDQDGDNIDSKPITADKFSRQQTTQQWGNTNRRAFNTI